MPWSGRANYGSVENGKGEQCQNDSHDDELSYLIEVFLFSLLTFVVIIILLVFLFC